MGSWLRRLLPTSTGYCSMTNALAFRPGRFVFLDIPSRLNAARPPLPSPGGWVVPPAALGWRVSGILWYPVCCKFHESYPSLGTAPFVAGIPSEGYDLRAVHPQDHTTDDT